MTKRFIAVLFTVMLGLAISANIIGCKKDQAPEATTDQPAAEETTEAEAPAAETK